MRKIITVIAVLLLFGSCESNEAKSLIELDIVGRWVKSKVLKDGIDVGNDCEKKSTVEFSSNNTFSGIYYYVVDNVCELNDTQNDTYALNGNKLSIGSDKVLDFEVINTNSFSISEGVNDDIEVYVRE